MNIPITNTSKKVLFEFFPFLKTRNLSEFNSDNLVGQMNVVEIYPHVKQEGPNCSIAFHLTVKLKGRIRQKN